MSPELSSRLTIILFLAVIMLVTLGGALLLLARPKPTAIAIHPPVPTATPAGILVYVTGAVHQPGSLHLLPFGSRVTDAISAAGGFTDLADQTFVNLARRLRDGDWIHASSIHQAGGDAVSPAGPIYINRATVAELETLPSIGPVMAQRIVLYREKMGPFTSLDDLDKVSGIGAATLEELRGLVAFD